jgi:hypothetical protein
MIAFNFLTAIPVLGDISVIGGRLKAHRFQRAGGFISAA